MKIPTDYSINVTTTPFSNGVIEQKTDIMGEVTRKIMDTREYQVQQALKQLGWLPPEEVYKLHKQLDIAETWISPYNVSTTVLGGNMNLSTQSHFNFVKELCDQYNVECELLDTCFPTIMVYPKEFKQLAGSCRVPDYTQLTFIWFEEDCVVKVCNGKALEYRQFNSYVEQMFDLHY